MIPLMISHELDEAVKGNIVPAVVKTTPDVAHSTYKIAKVLMEFVHDIMHLIGQDNNSTLFIWLYVIVVFGVAFAVGEILRWTLVLILRGLSSKIHSPFYKYLVQRRFFIKTCRIIPAILFLILIQFTLYFHNNILLWCTRISWIYIVICLTQSLCTLAEVIWEAVNEKENTRKLPLRGVVQVIKLILWIIAVIVIAAIFFNKSPGTLLAGLGAFAAVLMLIFKDSILGIVAGVQLAENDSLHVGDWISVKGSDANGIVDTVSLTEVKIINWDKTVTTVPPYTLISSGFRNYRNMQQSNTRRIQQSYMIDADSVVETTPEMLDEFSKIPLMKEWIAQKRAQLAEGKPEDVSNSLGLADGSLETNLGMFRAYMFMYLKSNPNIDKESTCFVTTLPQTPYGIPLQIYCFTSTSSWIPYEGIQAGVFEHLAAMLYRFKLYTFETPSGRDTLIDGYMSAGKNPENVFGMPYPFFPATSNPDNPAIPPAGIYPASMSPSAQAASPASDGGPTQNPAQSTAQSTGQSTGRNPAQGSGTGAGAGQS